MKISFLSGLTAFALAAVLASCGTGGKMDDPQHTNMTGDLPGTGADAQTAFEDADQPYNNQNTASTSRGTLPAGEVIKVDSTEARGNSRWNDEKPATTTTQTSGKLDKTAGLRARYSLIGSNPKNRSRIGQNFGSGNPESAKEEIYQPK